MARSFFFFYQKLRAGCFINYWKVQQTTARRQLKNLVIPPYRRGLDFAGQTNARPPTSNPLLLSPDTNSLPPDHTQDRWRYCLFLPDSAEGIGETGISWAYFCLKWLKFE